MLSSVRFLGINACEDVVQFPTNHIRTVTIGLGGQFTQRSMGTGSGR